MEAQRLMHVAEIEAFLSHPECGMISTMYQAAIIPSSVRALTYFMRPGLWAGEDFEIGRILQLKSEIRNRRLN
jgi:hypothetical protein